MSDRARFKCINPECGATYPLNTIIYRCGECGSLLEVQHDHNQLKTLDARTWKLLFEDRYKSNQWPYGSGVWGKKEWVLPEIEDENVVSLYEGSTNLFWADRFSKHVGLDELWIKLCGNTHSGSFKDLGMTVLVSMVKEMIARGSGIPAVACASTGDTSAARSHIDEARAICAELDLNDVAPSVESLAALIAVLFNNMIRRRVTGER